MWVKIPPCERRRSGNFYRKESGVKFYITEYALTKGIIEFQEAIIDKNCPEMLNPLGTNSTFDSIYKPFWHVRKKDAIEHAENLRKRKILWLEKQLNKLKSMRFE